MRKYLHYLGILLCILGISYVYMRLKPNLPLVINSLPHDFNTICFFCFLCFVYALALNLLALGWRGQIEFNTGVNLSFKSTLSIYAQSQIAKYIPGNVFQYLGRNILASRYQLDGLIVLKSSLYEIIALLLGALLLIAIMMVFLPYSIFLKTLGVIDIPNWLVLMGLSLAIILLMKNLRYIAKLKLFIKNFFAPYLCFTFSFHFVSVLTLMGLWLGVMHETLSFDSTIILGSAYLVSWVIGFVTPGSPGGLGVRETLFILLASITSTESQIILLMISSRLLNTLGDILFFLQGVWCSKAGIATL